LGRLARRMPCERRVSCRPVLLMLYVDTHIICRWTASNWALKRAPDGQQDGEALYPDDTFVAYEGDGQQVDGTTEEDLLAALSDGAWGAESSVTNKGAPSVPTTDALDALLKEHHRPPSSSANVSSQPVMSHSTAPLPKAPLSSDYTLSSYPRPSSALPGSARASLIGSRTSSYPRPSTGLSSGTSARSSLVSRNADAKPSAVAAPPSPPVIPVAKPSSSAPNASGRQSYTRPSPKLTDSFSPSSPGTPSNILNTRPSSNSSQKAPSPGISSRASYPRPSPTLSGTTKPHSPGLTSGTPHSGPSPTLGGNAVASSSTVLPHTKPSPSLPAFSQAPSPKHSNTQQQLEQQQPVHNATQQQPSIVKPSPSFSIASGPPSASAFAPVSKDDPFAFAYADSFLGKNEEPAPGHLDTNSNVLDGLLNQHESHPTYNETQEDTVYNDASYPNPTQYSTHSQPQQEQYSQGYTNPEDTWATYGSLQEPPKESVQDANETHHWSGQEGALANQQTENSQPWSHELAQQEQQWPHEDFSNDNAESFPQQLDEQVPQQWESQLQIVADPYSWNPEEQPQGDGRANNYSEDYGFEQNSAPGDSSDAQEHPAGYTEEPVFSQENTQSYHNAAYQACSHEYGFTDPYENQAHRAVVLSMTTNSGHASPHPPFVSAPSQLSHVHITRSSNGPSNAELSVSSSSTRDPLSAKRKGHALATFGPGGSLVVIRPKCQDWFERDPSTGRSKPVQKVTPGQVLLGCTNDYLSPAVAQLYSASAGPFLGGKVKTKKTAVQTWVQDCIKMSQSRGNTSQARLWKLLNLVLEHDGVLLGSKDEAVILPKLLNLIKSDSVPSNSASPSTLESLQTLLLEGKRSEACDLALTQSRYAHALIIASHVDKATYGRAITGFANQEFLGPVAMAFSRSNNSTDLEHEYLPLHVLYGLFGGKGHQAGGALYFFSPCNVFN
jgi:hypothetical protein